MYEQHAQFIDGSNSTEAGIIVMQERMNSKRLKVFANCTEWFDEFRLYHRKEGLIVKEHDDLMSATRMGTIMCRIAKPILLPNYGQPNPQGAPIAKGVDDSPWGV
jgi:hypothetical protein